MKEKLKALMQPALFALGGALAGLGYYTFAPCPTGTCPITSSPWSTMVYTGLIGLLISYTIREITK